MSLTDIVIAQPGDSRGGELAAVLGVPDGKGPFTALVVVHELFGIDDAMRAHLERLRGMGYVVLMPNLYSRGGARRCLVATFRSDAQQRLHLMSYCLDCQDWEGFRQQAHSFKGSCGNIGARALEQSCLAAELAGQQADGDRAKQALADMRRCFQRLQPLLSP